MSTEFELDCTCCKKDFPNSKLAWDYWNFGSSSFCFDCYIERYLPWRIKQKIDKDCVIIEKVELEFLLSLEKYLEHPQPPGVEFYIVDDEENMKEFDQQIEELNKITDRIKALRDKFGGNTT